MRKYLPLFLILPIYFTGCDKDNSPTGPENKLTFSYLSGKIEGWNSGSGKSVSFCVYPKTLSKAEISSAGSFFINCPKPPDELLTSITDSFVSPDIIISDSSAKFNYAVLNICYGGKDLGEAVQSDRKTADMYYLEDIGSFMIEYWYFDKTTVISGCNETREGYKTACYYYNITAQTGWNLITKSLSQNTAESKTYQMESGIAPNSRYYYLPYTSLKKHPLFSPSVLLRK